MGGGFIVYLNFDLKQCENICSFFKVGALAWEAFNIYKKGILKMVVQIIKLLFETPFMF